MAVPDLSRPCLQVGICICKPLVLQGHAAVQVRMSRQVEGHNICCCWPFNTLYTNLHWLPVLHNVADVGLKSRWGCLADAKCNSQKNGMHKCRRSRSCSGAQHTPRDQQKRLSTPLPAVELHRQHVAARALVGIRKPRGRLQDRSSLTWPRVKPEQEGTGKIDKAEVKLSRA